MIPLDFGMLGSSSSGVGHSRIPVPHQSPQRSFPIIATIPPRNCSLLSPATQNSQFSPQKSLERWGQHKPQGFHASTDPCSSRECGNGNSQAGTRITSQNLGCSGWG